MDVDFLCIHCGKKQPANPRLKLQRFCGQRVCQQARKSAWQRCQMADADARAEQRRLQDKWLEANPDYWRQYRLQNPKKAERNRLLQQLRRQAAREGQQAATAAGVSVAKMDAFVSKESQGNQGHEYFWVVPSVAKMDAFRAKIIIIPGPYRKTPRVAKRDAIDVVVASM